MVIFFVAGVLSGHIDEESHVPQPYKFGYESQDEWGSAQFRHEEDSGDGSKRGSFGYRDPHGMFRLVNYIADHDGFRAWVKTNEPGTVDSAPAATRIEKDGEAVAGVSPILSARRAVLAPVAASPVASYVPAPLPRRIAKPVAAVADVAYLPAVASSIMSPRHAVPISVVPKARPLSHPSQPEFEAKLALSAPLAYAESQVVQPLAQPVPVRRVVGRSAAAVASSPADIPSKIFARPKHEAFFAGPIVAGRLHAAASEAIVATPVLAAPAERPYEKFVATFRRRRPIQTTKNKEVFVQPTIFSVGGIPVYKDR